MLKRLLVAVPVALLATGGLFLAMRVLTNPSPGPFPEPDIIVEPGAGKTEAASDPVRLDPPEPNRAAIPILQPRPPYPECGNGRPEKVVLEFFVETNGSVGDVEIISAPSACFADAAKLAVLSWRYRPKVVNGRKVRSRVRGILHFVYLPPEPPPGPAPEQPYVRDAAPIVRPPPVYPECAEKAGEVILDFVVEPDGSVADIKVVSATSECFADAAKRAAAGWRYRPKVVNGRAVRSGRMRVKLVFQPE